MDEGKVRQQPSVAMLEERVTIVKGSKINSIYEAFQKKDSVHHEIELWVVSGDRG